MTASPVVAWLPRGAENAISTPRTARAGRRRPAAADQPSEAAGAARAAAAEREPGRLHGFADRRALGGAHSRDSCEGAAGPRVAPAEIARGRTAPDEGARL